MKILTAHYFNLGILVKRSELQLLLREKHNKNIVLVTKRDCWVCTSHYSDSNGYTIVSDKKRRLHRLHKVVYELTKKKIKKGNLVRHKCDNPPCCKPSHLLQGTHQDNKNDAVSRDRHARGERNRHAKLTPAQAKRIKYSVDSTKNLVTRYKVTRALIQGIRSGRYWKHL